DWSVAGVQTCALPISLRYPSVHGAPVHVGDPSALGITSLGSPSFGDPVEIRPGEVPVFWACGVTPQAVAAASCPELMITHAPGRSEERRVGKEWGQGR